MRDAGRSAGESKSCGQHGEAAHPVDQGVVHLQEERGAVRVDALDEDRLPERQRRVEAARRHRLGHVEDVPQPPVLGQPDAPEVSVEIERLVDDELGSSATRGTGDGPRAQARHRLGEAADARPHLGPVRRSVQQHQRHDGGAHDRVAADRPQQSIGAAHGVDAGGAGQFSHRAPPSTSDSGIRPRALIEPEVPNRNLPRGACPYPEARFRRRAIGPFSPHGPGPSIGGDSMPWSVRELDRGGHGATDAWKGDPT